MKRLLAILCALLVAIPADAAPRKPLVLNNGQTQQIQTGDTLNLPAPATDGSVILTPGSTPSAPTNGGCWTTTAGVYCRINGSTQGPFVFPTGTPSSGNLAKFSGSNSITNGDLSGDVSTSGTLVTTIGANKVTLADIAQIGTNTVLGNPTSGTANVSAMSMPSCSTVTQALTWTTSTGFGCQSPVPATAANPFGVGPIDIAGGTGSTGIDCSSTTALPEGSICGWGANGNVYVTHTPITAVPARVQEAVSSGSYSVTLGAAPKAGNVLYAYVYRAGSGALPTLASGWTSMGTFNGGASDPYVIVACRVVVSGDSASWTPGSGADNQVGAAIIEVSGVDMVHCSGSKQSLTFTGNSVGSGANSATTSFTTTTTNTLAIGFAQFTKQTGLGSNPQTLTTGFTNIVSNVGSTQAWNGTNVVGSQQVASSGTTVTETDTSSYSGGVANGVNVALLVVRGPTGIDLGQQLLSQLTVVLSGGSQISPTNNSARSLNFSTGLTAVDDGYGNETITAVSSGGTVTSVACPSATITTSGTCNPLGVSGTSGDVITGNGSSGLSDSGTALSSLAPKASPTFTGTITTPLTGGGTQCVTVDNGGVLSGTGSACGSGGGGGSGTVTNVATDGKYTSGGPITVTGTISGGPVAKMASTAEIMNSYGGL